VKFCQFVASSYLHVITNFGRFFLIFNRMALIFLGVPIVLTFQVSSYIKLNRRNFIANNELSPVNQTSIHWVITLGRMLESYYKLQPKLKQLPDVQMHFS